MIEIKFKNGLEISRSGFSKPLKEDGPKKKKSAFDTLYEMYNQKYESSDVYRYDTDLTWTVNNDTPINPISQDQGHGYTTADSQPITFINGSIGDWGGMYVSSGDADEVETRVQPGQSTAREMEMERVRRVALEAERQRRLRQIDRQLDESLNIERLNQAIDQARTTLRPSLNGTRPQRIVVDEASTF